MQLRPRKFWKGKQGTDLRATEVIFPSEGMPENRGSALVWLGIQPQVTSVPPVSAHRNLALSHIEHHRLSGIVHFASLSNTYDLHFFHHLRDIEVFGTWAMALVSAKKQKVKIEGPVCESSQVIGWHLNNKTGPDNYNIHISTFAFNSSILWDPERWGRPSSAQRTNQNSIKYVKEIIVEDEGKLKGIPPSDCSKIMLWHFPFSWCNSSNQLISAFVFYAWRKLIKKTAYHLKKKKIHF